MNSSSSTLYILVSWDNIQKKVNGHSVTTNLLVFIRFLESINRKIVLYLSDYDKEGLGKLKFVKTKNVHIKYLKANKTVDSPLNVSASSKSVIVDNVSYNLSDPKYKEYPYMLILYSAVLSYINSTTYTLNIGTTELYLGKVYHIRYIDVYDVVTNSKQSNIQTLENFSKVYGDVVELYKSKCKSV